MKALARAVGSEEFIKKFKRFSAVIETARTRFAIQVQGNGHGQQGENARVRAVRPVSHGQIRLENSVQAGGQIGRKKATPSHEPT